MSIETEKLSKANMLYLAEHSSSLDEGTLEDVTQSMEKVMKSKDWVEYATILKQQGMKHDDICNRVKKSPSWIKKYVNPMLKEVTPLIKLHPPTDTTNEFVPGLPIHTVLEITIAELKKETRTFGGWGSVEVLDSQKEVVSIEGLEAIMPTYMKRGSPIMYGHSNRHVGNVFKYKIKDKLVKGKNVPALWLEGLIHSDYKIDDMAWDALQYAYRAGLPVLSLGATPIGHPKTQCNDKACFKKYDTFQLYEFTITEQQQGSIGANPEATIEVALAKSKDIDMKSELDKGISLTPVPAKTPTKPEHKKCVKNCYDKHPNPKTHPKQEALWVSGGFLRCVTACAEKHESTKSMNLEDTELVNMMLASCGSCQDEFQKLIKQGKTEEQAKASLLKDLLKMVENLSTEQDNPDNSGNPDEIIKSAPLAKELTDLATALTKFDVRLGKIEENQVQIMKTASIGNTNAATADSAKQENGEEEEEEDDDKPKPPPVEKADTEEPAMTFSKDFEKQMEMYLEKKGFKKVAETPVPETGQGRAITEIQKGEANLQKQKSGPSSEEMLDAMADWKNGGVTKLAEKYNH